MKTTTLTINDNTYKVVIAEKEEDKKMGLRNIQTLPKLKGMLFVWDNPQNVSMTMDETLVPLDLIFIDEDGEVLKVAHRNDTEEDTNVSCELTKYVLEVNIHSGIEEGDIVECELFNEGNTLIFMKVLAPDGSTLMELAGGERIFSRKNTKILIKLAKKADKTKSDSDYKRLGKSVFKYLKGLDTRDPEYVKAPN